MQDNDRSSVPFADVPPEIAAEMTRVWNWVRDYDATGKTYRQFDAEFDDELKVLKPMIELHPRDSNTWEQFHNLCELADDLGYYPKPEYLEELIWPKEESGNA